MDHYSQRMPQRAKRVVFWAVACCGVSLCLTVLLLVQALHQSRQRQHAIMHTLALERQRATELRTLLDDQTHEVDRLAAQVSVQSALALQLEQVVSRQQEHISQLQTKLLMAQQQVAEKSARALPPASSVLLSTVTVPLGHPEHTGRILDVNPEWNFVVVNAGWERLNIGDVLPVYRDQRLVAQVEVERVQHEASAARVLPAYPIAAIHVNDQVVIR
jgi:hypothetical protein